MSDASVNFKVSGRELESYLDRIGQKATSMSKGMLQNARSESDSGKDQLKSYQLQIAMLERKLRLEADALRLRAEEQRSNRLDNTRQTFAQRMQQVDDEYDRKEIDAVTRNRRIEALDRGELAATRNIEEEYKQELQGVRGKGEEDRTMIRMMRENIDAIRSTSQDQLSQMRRGNDELIDSVSEDEDPSTALANKIASDQRADELKKEQKKQSAPSDTFAALMKAFAIEKVGGMLAGIPNAKNELDFIKPMMSALGMTSLGFAGIGLDVITGTKAAGFGLGQTSFGALGMQVGEKLGEFAGSAIERTFRSRDELMIGNYRLQAMLGRDIGVNAVSADRSGGTGVASITRDLARYGNDFKETSQMQLEIAKAQGTGRNIEDVVENMLAAQFGLGVDTNSFLSLTELLRSSTKDNRDVLRLIGGIAQAGEGNIFKGDRTFLNEFLAQNFNQMQKMLLSTQNTVASGTTFDILRRFDSIGGPFAARDSRSTGLVNTIQNSLSNPGADNMKALSMIMLRRTNPDMGYYDLLMEQQKGLASPTYLQSMLQGLESIGGGDDMQRLNLAGMLGLGGNLAAADLLYKNRSKLINGRLSTEELLGSGAYGQEGIRSAAQGLVSPYSQSTAEIENAYIRNAVEGIEVVGEKMTQLFGKMMDGVTDYIDKMFDDLKSGYKKKQVDPTPQTNATYNPALTGRRAAHSGW